MSEEETMSTESWRNVPLVLYGDLLERFSKRCVLNISCAVKNRCGVREFWDEISKDIQAEIIEACERAVLATVEAVQRNAATRLSTNPAQGR